MEKIGIIKEVDALGRLQIPKDYRTRFGLDGEVELIATSEGLLITSVKYRTVRIGETVDGEGRESHSGFRSGED